MFYLFITHFHSGYFLGLDLAEAAMHLSPQAGKDASRIAFQNYKFIGLAQESITSLDKVTKY